MFPECVCEVSAQNTQKIIFYSMFKLSFLGLRETSGIKCVPFKCK